MDLMQDIELAEGEVTEDQEQQLVINEQEREAKSVAYVCVIKDKENYINMLDDEIKRLTVAKKRHQTDIDRLKSNLLVAVRLFGDYAAGMFTISTRKSSAVVIEDEALLDADYIVSKMTTSVDKKKIKEDIKAGKAVSGAIINTNYNLNIK